MSLQFLDYEKIDKIKWQEMLAFNPFASPFQTPEYFNFLRNSKGFFSEVFALTNIYRLKILTVIAIFKEPGIKGVFSKRAVIFGGPLLSSDLLTGELEFFLKEVTQKIKSKAIYLETRNFFDYSAHKQAFLDAGWDYQPYLNIQLSLKNASRENILNEFTYNRRREIRLSISEGATYGLCESRNEIHEIYRILQDLYKKRVRLPLPPLSYFLELYDSQIAKVFVVRAQGKVIGGSLCPFLPGKAIYTYYYCGLREFHKNIFPAHLAILAAMEFAMANNIPMIDFMGAGKPNEEYGVRHYKSQFGGEMVEHGRFVKVLNPFLFQIGKAGLKILKSIS